MQAGTYVFEDSLSNVAGVVTLDNDEANPGGGKVYGTDTAGVKGWHDPVAIASAVASGILTLTAHGIENTFDPTDKQVLGFNNTTQLWEPQTPAVAAPTDAHYVTTRAETGLSAERNLGALSSGILKQTVAAGEATPAIAAAGTDYVDPSDTRLTNDRTANALRTLTAKAIDATTDPTNGQVLTFDNTSGKWKPATPTGGAVSMVRGFGFGKRMSALVTGKLDYVFTCPYAGTISGWNIAIASSGAATVTLKFWKRAGAYPTSANSINTSGISLTSGNYISSTVLTDFTTLAVAIGDVFAVEVVAVTGTITEVSGALLITT
jgi:hypothetical protein